MADGDKLASYPVFNGYAPAQGPRVIPMRLDFSSASEIPVDLLRENLDGGFAFCQSIYVDNTDNANPLTVNVRVTGQRLVIPAGAQGTWPLFSLDPVQLIFSTPADAGLIVPIDLLNVPLPISQWGPTTVTIGTINVSAILQGDFTDRSLAITLGGTSETLMAANANRQKIIIENPPTEIEPIYINFGAAASVANSIPILPGATYESNTFVSTQAINVLAATTSHVVIAKEGE